MLRQRCTTLQLEWVNISHSQSKRCKLFSTVRNGLTCSVYHFLRTFQSSLMGQIVVSSSCRYVHKLLSICITRQCIPSSHSMHIHYKFIWPTKVWLHPTPEALMEQITDNLETVPQTGWHIHRIYTLTHNLLAMSLCIIKVTKSLPV